MKSIFVSNLIAAAAILVSLSGCGGEAAEQAKKDSLKEIKIGLVGEHNAEWYKVAENLQKDNIQLTIVRFSDYTLPNRALNDGEIDLNAFQHKAYLKADSEANGFKLSPIGDTIICPLGAYSQKIRSLNDIKEGDTIAIPNDPTNGGRALKLLESAGLITLDKSKGYLPTVNDIKENRKTVKIYEVDAGNTPSLLPDVAVSVINSNYAVDNKLNPATDAIYQDTTGHIDENNPYVNIIAARTSDVNREDLKKVVRAFQTQEIAELILKEYHGVNLPVFDYKK